MPRHLLSGIVFLALLAAPPALAQYMYLDSNGDGVHTAADVLHGSGPTNVDVWLDTFHRRDGTEVSCPTQPGPINFGATVAVVLRANGGTFACSNVVSLQPLLSAPYQTGGNDTEFAFGFLGPAYPGAGKFDLARLTILSTGGTPSVEIIPVASTTLGLGAVPPFTEFGSLCAGANYDNTFMLGRDWFDVDGLVYESGGLEHAPVIPDVADMTTAVGETASRDLAVTDADGNVVALAIASGPGFLTVSTIASNPGLLQARLLARPRRGQTGSFVATLSATDGSSQSTRDVAITVQSGADHLPQAPVMGRVDAVASTISRTILTATDSDGDPIRFTKASGPDYAEVQTLQTGHGGATGALILRPTICDIGTTTVVIALEDGYGTASLQVPVRVVAAAAAPVSPPTVNATYPMHDLAVGDLNEDGHADAVAVGEIASALQVFLGNGNGAMVPAGAELPNLSSVAVALGDWDGDGHLDVAVGGMFTQALRILKGRGDGTFMAPVEIPGVLQANQLVSADLNGDGVSDLLATGEDGSLSVLLGHTGTGPQLFTQLPMPSVSSNVVAADFDLDGAVDLAVSTLNPSNLMLFLGRGDGTFGEGRSIPNPKRGLFALVGGDWNSDGKWDLAVAAFAASGISLGFGDGAGGLSFTSLATMAVPTYCLASTDWNADGNADILVASEEGPGPQLALGHGDGTFSLVPFGSGYSSNVRFADLNEDGRPDAIAVYGNQDLAVLLNPTTAPTGVLASAYLSDAKTVTVVPSARPLRVSIEPSDGTFNARDVDPASLRLSSAATGSASSIAASSDKTAELGDADHDGVADLTVSFGMDAVATLFDALHGKQSVPVRLEGALTDQRRLCAPFTMSINVVGSGSLAAHITPNPLNPSGTLHFALPRKSEVTIRIYDVSGRVVRTVWDRRMTEPGLVDVPVEGRTATGEAMASGIYFYRIEAGAERSQGRFTVLK